ncbi:dTDP-4-amino-4,6-dideoxygalactose transaminase [Desulfotignum phosphitoxidans]|nr:dTDP-4-amino-4,6-dideoxygalactose transaminase [Desulfotignum phosphitoxidans]
MTDNIPFNKPFIAGKELYYMAQAILGGRSAGDGPFTKKCQRFIQTYLGTPKALLTQSYASALDMAAMLCEAGPGDEVIMPSFAFVSVANAFHMQGATPVFVDIRPHTLNLDADQVARAVTDRTRVIVTPHYAGIGCDMEKILEIARHHGLLVVEDAANGFGARYGGTDGKCLGTMGDLGILSFHETNNVICGEGGALLINNERFYEKAEIIREKGTNRSKFFRGEVDKYTWVDIGSSFLPSDLVAAFLFAQLEMADTIIAARSRLFAQYIEGLQELADKGFIRLPHCHEDPAGNSHIMYVITRSRDERDQLVAYLKDRGIYAVIHFSPLHLSPMGAKYGRVFGDMTNTRDAGERLLRLPLYYDMTDEQVDGVVGKLSFFFEETDEKSSR